jgi:chromosome segregation ATPase
MSDRHDPDDDRMTAVFNKLEGHLLELSKAVARLEEAVSGVKQRLDVLNGRMPKAEEKIAEQATRLAELAVTQRQELSEHTSKCEVRAALEDILQQLAANAAAAKATDAANKSWKEALLPVATRGLKGLLWLAGAILVYNIHNIGRFFDWAGKSLFKQ